MQHSWTTKPKIKTKISQISKTEFSLVVVNCCVVVVVVVCIDLTHLLKRNAEVNHVAVVVWATLLLACAKCNIPTMKSQTTNGSNNFVAVVAVVANLTNTPKCNQFFALHFASLSPWWVFIVACSELWVARWMLPVARCSLLVARCRFRHLLLQMSYNEAVLIGWPSSSPPETEPSWDFPFKQSQSQLALTITRDSSNSNNNWTELKDRCNTRRRFDFYPCAAVESRSQLHNCQMRRRQQQLQQQQQQ